MEENCHRVLLTPLARAVQGRLAVGPPKPAPHAALAGFLY